MKDAKGHGSNARGAHQDGVDAALSGVVMRRPGEDVGAGLDALTQPGHVYRGMSGAEYIATVGYSTRASIPQDRVSRVWRMANEGGAVVGRRVK